MIIYYKDKKKKTLVIEKCCQDNYLHVVFYLLPKCYIRQKEYKNIVIFKFSFLNRYYLQFKELFKKNMKPNKK